MSHCRLTLLPERQVITAETGQSLWKALCMTGIGLEAPCGGKGQCGKCRCTLNGKPVLACQTVLTDNCEVALPSSAQIQILTESAGAADRADGTAEYAFAADVGTTTVVLYLLDGKTGSILAAESAQNPQAIYGGDVISRIQFVLEHPGTALLRGAVLDCLNTLAGQAARAAGVDPKCVSMGCVVGNTAMHHLLLGIDPKPLTQPPYMPRVYEKMEVPGLLAAYPNAAVRILPNIAGFVGADTVACMEAVRLDAQHDLTLVIDIGTNGEMVLGSSERRIACSTAAGPAFEGAKIRFGMRGASGAIDHVNVENGELRCSVIGGGKAEGICGSGLLEAVWRMLQTNLLEESGRMRPENGKQECWGKLDGMTAYHLSGDAWLTQKDVRELQLAKAAIRAGVELLMKRLGGTAENVQKVLLAGAFGNYLSPEAACGIGMLPPELLDKIVPIGNAAGLGAQICAVSRSCFEHTSQLAQTTEFLELAGIPEFQDCYVDCLSFGEDM